MKKLHFSVLVCFLIILTRCSNGHIATNDIDKFISKYQDVNFNEIKNTYIHWRSRSFTEVIYVVGQPQRNLPAYFVTFDLLRDTITNINRSNLEKPKVADYLTPSEIATAVNLIRQHKFYFLGVDSLENVYINPFYADEPPYFLRLKTPTGDSTIREGYDYELYKDNWYLNKDRK